MTCEGLPAVTYDLYVLGLLDDQEERTVSSHIESQCPACIQGVQRSMNLWLVFASTLQNAEPSASFKSRLTQIAELSRRVLTFPKGPVSLDRGRSWRWMLICLAFGLGTLLTLGGWRAGRSSASIEQQRLTNELAKMSQRVTTLDVQLQQESDQRRRTETLLGSSGHRSALDELAALQTALVRAQAEANQYKLLSERDRAAEGQNRQLLAVLSQPHAHLLPLKGLEAAASGVAYVIVAPDGRLILVASNLPKLAEGHVYQLWVLRKEEPKIVSAGIFASDAKGTGFLQVDDATVVSGFSSVIVTEEPQRGSDAPTGSKLFVENPPAAS